MKWHHKNMVLWSLQRNFDASLWRLQGFNFKNI